MTTPDVTGYRETSPIASDHAANIAAAVYGSTYPDLPVTVTAGWLLDATLRLRTRDERIDDLLRQISDLDQAGHFPEFGEEG